MLRNLLASFVIIYPLMGIVILNAQPIVTSVTSNSANGVYGKDEIIEINIVFDQEVFVSGNPRLLLDNSAGNIYAEYVNGLASSSIAFSFTVTEGMSIADLNYVDELSLELNDGTIENETGEDADLTLPAPMTPNSLGGNTDITVDGVSPIATVSVSPIKGVWKSGNDLTFTAVIAENFNVSEIDPPKITIGDLVVAQSMNFVSNKEWTFD